MVECVARNKCQVVNVDLKEHYHAQSRTEGQIDDNDGEHEPSVEVEKDKDAG